MATNGPPYVNEGFQEDGTIFPCLSGGSNIMQHRVPDRRYTMMQGPCGSMMDPKPTVHDEVCSFERQQSLTGK